MSDKASSAGNQQETPTHRKRVFGGSSETTRQTPITKPDVIAYLNGALYDASLNKGKRIRFAQQNKEWLKNIKLLLGILNCRSWIYKEGKERNVYVLETLCKDLDFAFDPHDLKTTREKVNYIRGFFDAEGGLPHTTGRFYIQLVQKNLSKIKKLKKLLQDIGIESGKIHNPSKRADPNYWRIFVSTKHHLRFAKVVNSYHPLKIKIFRDRMKI